MALYHASAGKHAADIIAGFLKRNVKSMRSSGDLMVRTAPHSTVSLGHCTTAGYVPAFRLTYADLKRPGIRKAL